MSDKGMKTNSIVLKNSVVYYPNRENSWSEIRGQSCMAGSGFDISTLPTKEAKEVAQIMDKREGDCSFYSSPTSKAEYYGDGRLNLRSWRDGCGLAAVLKLSRQKGYRSAEKLFKSLASDPEVVFAHATYAHQFKESFNSLLRTHTFDFDDLEDFWSIAMDLRGMKRQLRILQTLFDTGDLTCEDKERLCGGRWLGCGLSWVEGRSAEQRERLALELKVAKSKFEWIRGKVREAIPEAGSEIVCRCCDGGMDHDAHFEYLRKFADEVGKEIGVEIPYDSYCIDALDEYCGP